MRPWALLLLPIVYAVFSLPAYLSELSRAREYLSASKEERLAIRTDDLTGAIREIDERLSPAEPLLLDMPGQDANLIRDRALHYWLYPRTVYSAEGLRILGVDVREFAESRRIQWVFDGQSLIQLDSTLPPREIQEPSSPFHFPSSPLRAWFGVLAGLAHFTLAGYGVLRGSGTATILSSRTERLAASFLTGMGVVAAWTLLCFVTGLGVRLSTVLSSFIPLAFVFLWSRRRPARKVTAAQPRSAAHWTDRLAIAAAAVLFVLLLFRAVSLPMLEFDDRYQWAHKAHIMLHEESVRDSGFEDPYTPHFHPRYPLLIPSAEAVLFLYAGGFDDQYAKILFPLSLGALLVLVFSGLASLGRRAGSGIAVLTLLLLPYYFGYGIDNDGGSAFTAYPDLLLSVFLTAAILYFLRSRQSGGGRLVVLSSLLLLFASLTKAEGTVHLFLFSTLAVIWLAFAWKRSEDVVLAVAALATTVALVLAYRYAVVAGINPGILPDDYSMLLTWSRFSANAERIPEIQAVLFKDLFLSPRFGFWGLALIAAASFRWRAVLGPESLLPTLYALAIATALCIPYVVLPPSEWEQTYVWSSGRVLSQITPIALMGLFLSVLPLTRRNGD